MWREVDPLSASGQPAASTGFGVHLVWMVEVLPLKPIKQRGAHLPRVPCRGQHLPNVHSVGVESFRSDFHIVVGKENLIDIAGETQLRLPSLPTDIKNGLVYRSSVFPLASWPLPVPHETPALARSEHSLVPRLFVSPDVVSPELCFQTGVSSGNNAAMSASNLRERAN